MKAIIFWLDDRLLVCVLPYFEYDAGEAEGAAAETVFVDGDCRTHLLCVDHRPFPEAQERYRQKSFLAFGWAMASHPSVIRLQYTYLLVHNDERAAKQQRRFEKAARSYPCPCEIEGERELLAYARTAYDGQETEP